MVLAHAPEAPAEGTKIQLDLVSLLGHASWPVKITVALLVLASLMVWIISILKFLQLYRLRGSQEDFERAARRSVSAVALYSLVQAAVDAPGARVVKELRARRTNNVERLRAAADRAIVDEKKRARSLLSALGSIASAAPFIGLFGTVFGIIYA